MISNLRYLMSLTCGAMVGALVSPGIPRRMRRLRIEAERARQQHRAETQAAWETDGLRTRLLRTLAHELRTPLATVSAHLESLALDDDLPREERRRYVRIALAAARRLTELIDASRRFEDLSVSRDAFAPEPFQLVELAHDVAEKASRAANPRGGVTFRIEHPDRVPLIIGDIRLLERVFDVALARAAAHAAPLGEVLVRILPQRDAMRVEVRGGRVAPARASVRGVHPPPASVRFASDYAMLRKILEMHGRRIVFTELPASGVRFLFDLSLAPAGRRLPSVLRSLTSVRAAWS